MPLIENTDIKQIQFQPAQVEHKDQDTVHTETPNMSFDGSCK